MSEWLLEREPGPAPTERQALRLVLRAACDDYRLVTSQEHILHRSLFDFERRAWRGDLSLAKQLLCSFSEM